MHKRRVDIQRLGIVVRIEVHAPCKDMKGNKTCPEAYRKVLADAQNFDERGAVVVVEIEKTRDEQALVHLPKTSLNKLRDGACSCQVHVQKLGDDILVQGTPWSLELDKTQKQKLGVGLQTSIKNRLDILVDLIVGDRKSVV